MFSCVSEKDEIPILTKTPSRSKKLVNFFRTPQMVKPGVSEPGVEQDGDEFDAFVNQGSIAERLNVKGETPTLLVQPEFPRLVSHIYILKQDIRIYVPYSRPNGYTDSAEFFCGHSGAVGG